MVLIQGVQKDLWSELCEDRIGNKLSEVWEETEEKLGLNFLSLRTDDLERHFHQKPEWGGVMDLISSIRQIRNHSR